MKNSKETKSTKTSVTVQRNHIDLSSGRRCSGSRSRFDFARRFC